MFCPFPVEEMVIIPSKDIIFYINCRIPFTNTKCAQLRFLNIDIDDAVSKVTVNIVK